mgnify:CR=1 FL=1
MKKLLVGLLVFCFLVAPWVCFAQGETHAQVIYTWTSTVTSETRTNIPTDQIRPNVDKILGMEVLQAGGASAIATLWDGAVNTAATSDEVMAEVESTAYGPGVLFFPFPRMVVTQATVVQSASSTVIVYYVRQ